MMLSRNREELIDELPGGFWIIKPELILKKHPHRIHTDRFSQAKFLIIEGCVEGRMILMI